MALQSYEEVIKYLSKQRRTRHVLLGNGFSMAYDKDIFSYNALSSFIENAENKLLKHLFEIINTYNFEQIMGQLDMFYKLADKFLEDKALAKKILVASDSLKASLIDAVSELHPEHVYIIPEDKSRSCAQFLNEYLVNDGHIFTTNYDLLLYWVLMANMTSLGNVVDGFGMEYLGIDDLDPDSGPQFGDLEWGPNSQDQHIHYLHGALHLFDTGTAIEKEIFDGEYLLENIKQRMSDKEYPVFVTAGDGDQKLGHILHNQYLNFCYEALCKVTGSLITVGFGFGSSDNHIIDAINKAALQHKSNCLRSIYIGVFSDEDEQHIQSIKTMFRCKVNIFDAKTVNIWNRFVND